ncbi:MAG: hypothetical protein KDD40_08760 [Bdellovibrionales bacterium]|nr:hypothetical protein [Bdellovibrionales bacterium]
MRIGKFKLYRLFLALALLTVLYNLQDNYIQQVNSVLEEGETSSVKNIESPSLVKQKNKITPPVETSTDKTEKVVLTETIEKTPTPPQNLTASGQSLEPQVKPGHVVFQVKMDNWLVTHGDILLGQLKEPVTFTQGQYKPPAPKLWEQSRIPYVIADNYPYPELIEDVIAYFRENTPIRFVKPQAQDKDGIVFQLGEEHCYSFLGKMGGFQPIFLAEECRGPQIIHEILHALGFIHEQSRTDRDNYLEIMWSEIQADFRAQFMKVPTSYMLGMKNSKFDYRSAMLYQPTAFANNPGTEVMKSKTKNRISPTQEGLSAGDIERLIQVYGTL